MAVSKKVKTTCQDEIFALLEKYGKNADFASLYRKYSNDIPQSTFYRWVKKTHDSGIPARRAIKKARRRVKRKARDKGITDKSQLADTVSAEVVEVLPILPVSSDIVGISLLEAGKKLNNCIIEMESVIAYAKKEDGSIRNVRLLLQGAEGLRRTIDSAAKLSEALWDVRRTEQFFTALFNQLRHRDPELIELVLSDLKQINKDWGLA